MRTRTRFIAPLALALLFTAVGGSSTAVTVRP